MEVSKEGIPVRQSQLEALPESYPEVVVSPHSKEEHIENHGNAGYFSRFGSRRKRWIWAAVVVVVIVGAVVGGVVGGLQSRKKSPAGSTE
jgi:hypothetical protein